MPRPHRIDSPGCLHHVFNRGIARRTAFETRDDIRFALALLAREVRAGRLRILAYAFLTTHFHLLVESPVGELSGAMQRVWNLYVRRFNRVRRRDGPLFRGRFGSRSVKTDAYRRTLVRYIDQNAPQARLAHAGSVYPFGSAIHYVAPSRPPWLETNWVDTIVGGGDPGERRARYVATFGARMESAESALVGERMRVLADGPDDLDDLVGAAPEEILRWMTRKAWLADGSSARAPCAAPEVVDGEVAAARALRGDWTLRVPGPRRHPVWPVIRAGLLRDLAAASFADIAGRLNVTNDRAERLVRRHRFWLAALPEYASAVGEVARSCLAGLPR